MRDARRSSHSTQLLRVTPETRGRGTGGWQFKGRRARDVHEPESEWTRINWRAGCAKRCMSGSEGARRKRSSNATSPTGYPTQKRLTFTSPITLFPEHKTHVRDKGNRVLLDGWRWKTPSGKTNLYLLSSCAPECKRDEGERSFSEGILTNDDDTLAHLKALMRGRCGCLLFKPPFDSHDADRIRSERQPPCFLRMEWNAMTQSIRECAAGCLDGVVSGCA
jgi:hypothetical protein